MKKLILLIGLSLTLIVFSQAQTVQKSSAALEEELLQRTTLQETLENALISDTSWNRQLQSEENALNVQQNGSYNKVNVIVTRNANSLNILQEGIENSINYQSSGEDVNTSILQKGNNNNVEQTLSCNDLNYTIEQYGDKNNLKVVEDGKGLPNLIIRQWNGSNLEITKGIIYR